MKTLLRPALVLLLSALPLAAQPGPGRGPRAEGIARALKLSDTQKASILSIREKNRPALALRMETNKQARLALRTALADAATPEAQLRTLHDKAAAAQFEVMLTRRALRKEVQAVLTPEQQAKSAELRTLAQARMQQRMGRVRMALGMGH